MATIKTSKGGQWLGDNFVVYVDSECKECTPDEAGYNHFRCPEIIYGMRGFGINLYDSICSCPHHVELQPFVERVKIVEAAIEDSIDRAIEERKGI